MDSKQLQKGMVDIRNVDPLKIKKVRNVEKDKDSQSRKIKKVEEFYVFNDKGFDKSSGNEGATLKIAPEAVSYTTSGMLDYNKNIVIGYLHKALKTANQLAMMEDALVFTEYQEHQKEEYSILMLVTCLKAKQNNILQIQ